MTNRPATMLDQLDALATAGIPWHIVLPAGDTHKRVIGQIGGAWYLMPAGSWSVRDFQSAVADGTIPAYSD